jgi:predicted alternative tryptophan synthase beta-subunit
VLLLQQTIVGLEAMEPMRMADAWPDVVVGCTGGGSHFAGELEDESYDERELAMALAGLPSVPEPA